MSPEVKNRKITQLITYYNDLKPYAEMNYDSYFPLRYAAERLIQLFIDTSVDLLAHILKDSFNRCGKTYKEVFLLSAELDLIDKKLAQKMVRIVRLRNELVHLYGKMEPDAVHNQLGVCLENFEKFIRKIREKI
jgi:uncharacterized protein YutE (UPF0331/DUF86 family)